MPLWTKLDKTKPVPETGDDTLTDMPCQQGDPSCPAPRWVATPACQSPPAPSPARPAACNGRAPTSTTRPRCSAGAALYMNYCSGCHSLKYVRYAQIGRISGLTEDQAQANLNFTGAKIGDHVIRR